MQEFLTQLWNVSRELAPALFLGLLLAGLLHEFLPQGIIRKHLRESSLASVARAVLIGVPMPLCSCGVVPAAIGLHRQGASKAASTGFLISTPQTGADSILVTSGFLGWPFAVFKLVAAAVTGLIGGLLVGLWDKEPPSQFVAEAAPDRPSTSIARRLSAVVTYALNDLLAAIDVYLAIGLVVAAVIGIVIPPGFFQDLTWTQGFAGMLIALAISMPMYVCTTSSVPIAASLIAAGMPAGTALVFLMAGPATNAATIGAVYRGLGRKVLTVYLLVVAVMSILFGLLFDGLLKPSNMPHLHHHHAMFTLFDSVLAALLWLVLGALLVRRVVQRMGARHSAVLSLTGADMNISVKGMTCPHCAASVTKAALSVPGVTTAVVDLPGSLVKIEGIGDRTLVAKAIREAGYLTPDDR